MCYIFMRSYITNGADGPMYVEKPCEGCWINVEQPSEADMAFLGGELGVPQDFLESIGDADERPRIERDEKWTLTIVRIPVVESESSYPFTTIPLGIIYNDTYAITVTMRRTEMIPDFIKHAGHRHIAILNRPDFILRIIFSSTYWFLNYLKHINRRQTEAEHRLRKSVRNNDLIDLMRLQKSLVFFNTSIQGNEVLLTHLENVYADEFNHELLEDVEIELQQAANTVKVYAEILSSTLDTYASVVSNNVNDIMKRMTAVSIVLMIPTLVASFWGMNVEVPLGAWRFGFWAISAGSFVLSAAVYIILRRLRWL